MNENTVHIFKWIWLAIGGVFGWITAVFAPTLPLVTVMICFVLFDAWTAFQLDKRVKRKYPSKTKRREAKFTSFAFGKVIRKTIPERIVLILLAYLAERYVCVHVDLPLSYMVTGIIIFEQSLSCLENQISCSEERDNLLWRLLKKVLIDKTLRHLDDEMDSIKEIIKEEKGE